MSSSITSVTLFLKFPNYGILEQTVVNGVLAVILDLGDALHADSVGLGGVYDPL